MIYATRSIAVSTLLGLTPVMRSLHRVVPATIAGVRVGWTVVMIDRKVRS